jgi:hypothetical protein
MSNASSESFASIASVARRSICLPLLVLASLILPGCRSSRPGDSGGAATGDSLDADATGSARSNEAIERRRPVDTTLPGRIHDARGADTSAR